MLMENEIVYIISIFLLFSGLLLLLTGFLLGKRKESHIILVLGWITFGIFWLIQIPHFLDMGDLFNSTFCLLGFILFLYLSYHEILNIKWNEYVYSLNLVAGVVAVGGLFYYLIEPVKTFFQNKFQKKYVDGYKYIVM